MKVADVTLVFAALSFAAAGLAGPSKSYGSFDGPHIEKTCTHYVEDPAGMASCQHQASCATSGGVPLCSADEKSHDGCAGKHESKHQSPPAIRFIGKRYGALHINNRLRLFRWSNAVVEWRIVEMRTGSDLADRKQVRTNIPMLGWSNLEHCAHDVRDASLMAYDFNDLPLYRPAGGSKVMWSGPTMLSAWTIDSTGQLNVTRQSLVRRTDECDSLVPRVTRARAAATGVYEKSVSSRAGEQFLLTREGNIEIFRHAHLGEHGSIDLTSYKPHLAWLGSKPKTEDLSRIVDWIEFPDTSGVALLLFADGTIGLATVVFKRDSSGEADIFVRRIVIAVPNEGRSARIVAIRLSSAHGYIPIGLLDEDGRLWQTRINGGKVTADFSGEAKALQDNLKKVPETGSGAGQTRANQFELLSETTREPGGANTISPVILFRSADGSVYEALNGGSPELVFRASPGRLALQVAAFSPNAIFPDGSASQFVAIVVDGTMFWRVTGLGGPREIVERSDRATKRLLRTLSPANWMFTELRPQGGCAAAGATLK